MRIYLIGLPGVGKSSVGKALAEKLKYEFIDLDIYIEQKAMMFIDELFHSYGESYFRALETEMLKEVSTKDNVVISCGGGIVKKGENKKWMDGYIIYLKAPIDIISKRLEESLIERPLLASKTLADLDKERKELYASFSTIEIENLEMEETINMILERIAL